MSPICLDLLPFSCHSYTKRCDVRIEGRAVKVGVVSEIGRNLIEIVAIKGKTGVFVKESFQVDRRDRKSF